MQEHLLQITDRKVGKDGVIMSKLIILRGNSGSGKTTIAKELQKKIGSNTLVISQDAIRREMLMVSDGPDTLALPLLKDLLRYGKEHCETVILEGIMVADWYHPLFELAKELTALKNTEEHKWLKDVPNECLQQSLRNLDNAYTQFFKAKKGCAPTIYRDWR